MANLQRQQQENNRRNKKLYTAILFNALFGIYMSLGLGPFTMGLKVIFNMLMGWVINALRQSYLDRAAHYFRDKKQIENIPLHEHRVITALEKGACSVTWGNYFLSYFSYSALRHPRVFAAGMELALENKHKHVEIIHQKYNQRTNPPR